MTGPVELARRELELRLDIARRELACMAEDGADGDAIDAKIEECELLLERQRQLDQVLRRIADV
jgi:hypothetical protein